MANVPRLDVISQSIAISGFTDDARRAGHIDLTDKIPAGSFVLGWKADITTRFTGGAGNGAELTVGYPGAPNGLSAGGWHAVESGAGSALADAPLFPAANPAQERVIRVTARDPFDFGNITGGALTLSVYYLRTVA